MKPGLKFANAVDVEGRTQLGRPAGGGRWFAVQPLRRLVLVAIRSPQTFHLKSSERNDAEAAQRSVRARSEP